MEITNRWKGDRVGYPSTNVSECHLRYIQVNCRVRNRVWRHHTVGECTAPPVPLTGVAAESVAGKTQILAFFFLVGEFEVLCKTYMDKEV